MSDLTNMIAESLETIHFAKKIILAISKKTDHHSVDELWQMICDKSEKEVRKVFKTKKVRSTNAYAFFVQDEETQNEVNKKLDNSDLTHKEKFAKKASLISEMWKKLEDKTKYTDLATESKKDADLQNGCKKKAKRKTAYQLFCDDIRPSVKNQNPTADFGDIQKLISEKWSELKETDNDKVEYWKTQSENYNQKEKEKHNELLVTKAIQDEEKLEELEKQKELTETEKSSSKKKSKKENTPFDKFKKKERKNVMKQNPDIANDKDLITQKLNDLWKSLSETEKNKY